MESPRLHLRVTAAALVLALFLPLGVASAGAKKPTRYASHDKKTHVHKKHKKKPKPKPAPAQSTAAPCPSKPSYKDAGKASARVFYNHVKYAHLQTSPGQQAHDLLNVKDYTKLHVVWLQSVVAPLQAAGGSAPPCESSSPPSKPASKQPAGPSGPQSASAARGVEIQGNAYRPAMLHIPAGTKVTWTSLDEAAHTVTSKNGSGPMDSKLLHKGDSYSHTFNRAGTYEYYCAVHPDMTAEVMVM